MGLHNPAIVNVQIPSTQTATKTILTTEFNVGASASLILSNDDNRLGFIVFNTDSNKTVRLVYDAGSGNFKTITEIPPKGTYFDDFKFAGTLRAISPSGTVAINVTEFIKQQ